MILLAIDPSLSSTGFAVFDEDGKALKYYIYDTEQVETVLAAIGYGDIKLNPERSYWHFPNIDGDNPYGIIVYNTPYLGVINNTRGYSFDNKNGDIISLVRFTLNCGYKEALTYIRSLLDCSMHTFSLDNIKKHLLY